jgi:hypothetical protein
MHAVTLVSIIFSSFFLLNSFVGQSTDRQTDTLPAVVCPLHCKQANGGHKAVGGVWEIPYPANTFAQ